MAYRAERVKRGGQAAGEQARTRLARRDVIAAAAVLFAQHGFAATTVAALSERSEVPQPTIYRLFGSKLEILKAWLEVAIGGDDAPVAVADRPQIADVLTDADPRQVIVGFAHVTVGINGRTSTVYRVLVGAAATDPTAAALLLAVRRQRASGQRLLTRALARMGALPAELTERRAADIVYAVMSPETHRLLVTERRWSVRQYEQWLHRTMCDQLLSRDENVAPPAVVP